MRDDGGVRGDRYPELGWRVLEAAPVLILVLDADGAIQHVNPYFERLTGFRLDEVHGTSWCDSFLPERDRDRMRPLFKQSSWGERVRERVSPIVTRAGDEREIEWTHEMLRDGDGHATGLLAIGHDVTEREAAQAALRESERRLAEAHQLANIGAWNADLDTLNSWWSEQQYLIAGLPVGTLVTWEVLQSYIHPDDRDIIARGIETALDVGAWEAEYRIVRPDGEVRDLLGRSKVVRDASGRPVKLVGTTQDITDRKRTETALRDSEQRYRTTVENMPESLILYDRDSIILYANPAVAATLRRSPEELVGKRSRDVWPGNGVLQCEMFDRAIATHERQTQEFTVEIPGRPRLVRELTMVPLVDTDGEVRQVLAMSRDTTAQRDLVEKLREEDRRKNDFIAVLSHELRNPLSAMRSALYVIEQVEPGDDQARRSHAIIERQVNQLTRLVDDLLDVSRITQSKIQLQRAPLDLERLVRTVIDDHQALFANRGVRLETKLAGVPLIVNGDAARLTQVIGNLLHNAAKFTPAGGLTTVSVTADAATRRAVLRVADTGAGIDPTMIGRLFQPFAQADRTLARSMGGLGLGLALVKGLVELHGGEVSVSSEGEGRGAELVVRLPLEQPLERPSTPVGKRPATGPARRVLVIEDNLDAADALRTVLELHGHAVEVAHNGVAGIQLAREFQPHVVLSDLGLPGMSGYDIARAFKHDEELRSVTLVAVSGYAAPDDVERTRDAGFDHHLAKPLDLDRLRGVLDGAAHASAADPRRS